MSGNMQVKDDPNTGGGLAETLQTFFFASSKITAVNNTPVTDHPPDHSNVKTANGSSFFNIDGKPVNFFGNADTCGHTRAGSQVPWFIIQS